MLSAEQYGETLKQEIETSASGALCKMALPAEDDKGTWRSPARTAGGWRDRRISGRHHMPELTLARSAGRDTQLVRRSCMRVQHRADTIFPPAAPSTVPSFQLASGMNPASDSPAIAADEEYTLWLHSRKRLFGGAQYWRALQEFMLGAAEGPNEEVCAQASGNERQRANPSATFRTSEALRCCHTRIPRIHPRPDLGRCGLLTVRARLFSAHEHTPWQRAPALGPFERNPCTAGGC